jgi:hypothetical protein
MGTDHSHQARNPLACHQARVQAMQALLQQWEAELGRHEVGRLVINFAHAQVKAELHISVPPHRPPLTTPPGDR